ncbi:hypothetical protein CK556_02400 [Mesoplasma chauliocola]|uniref:Uncharacterized protein n=1 Tax=Mesoplasma chauliocola TaxID=216427 RepID=A0A249SNF1_9MOLU|nr:hypothetical protein [Mesoplasma chauliocola]ASZ09195.1 hypothetical protein CK556_02400 [Mesoplasma chauliocola]
MKHQSQMLKILVNQWIIFKSQKTNFAILLINIFLVLMLNLIGVFILQSKELSVSSRYVFINLFIVINSVLILISCAYFTINILHQQITNMIYKVEMKMGYSVNLMYWIRIISIMGLMFSVFVVNLLISSLFFSIVNIKMTNDILVYRLYISAYGWYAIWIFLVMFICIIFSLIFKKDSLMIMSSILLSILLIISAVFSPSIIKHMSPAFSSLSGANRFALKNVYSHDLNKQVESNELLTDIQQRVKNNSKVRDSNEIVSGYKYWVEIYPTFNDHLLEEITNNIELIYKDVTLIEWDNIFNDAYSENLFNLNARKVVKYALDNNEIEEHDIIFEFVLNNVNNLAYYKNLSIVYKANDPSTPDDRERYEIIKQLYNPAEFLFTRIMMETILNSYSNLDSYNVIGIEYDVFKENKKQTFKNWINPFNHFNLMFNSVNYKNDVLMNFVSSEQLFLGSNYNLKVIASNKEDNSTWKLKRSVPVEVLYIGYTIFMILILVGLSYKFKVKVYEN